MAYESTYPPHPEPPAGPPELPPGVTPFPRWPAWYGPVGLIGAFVVATIAYLIVKAAAVAGGANPNHDSHAVILVATILQDLILVGAAFGLASLTSKPHLWHFGLKRGRFWSTAGWAALGLASFYALSAVYLAAVHPHGKQHVAQDLGAGGSTLGVIAVAFSVVVVAPVCEEIFFRGFFYRALRTRLNIPLAALIDGTVFGVIHVAGSPVGILPVLAILGVIFCLVYEKTGTLFATIALHAVNNAISYGATVHHGAAPSIVFGVCVVGGCVLVPRLLQARTPSFA